MTCEIHKQRKRKNCKFCFPESEISEKTSRDMLKDLEKEEESLVIKQKRTIKSPAQKSDISKKTIQEAIKNVKEKNNKENSFQRQDAQTEATEKENNPIKNEEVFGDKQKQEIDTYLKEKISDFKEMIYEICNQYHEHLAIPSHLLNLKELNVLEKDGFRLACLLDKDCAKVSGYSESVFIFERMKSDERKNIKELRERFKGR